MPQTDLEKRLLRLGLIKNVSGGVQIDINVASQRISPTLFRDAHSCDHNCTSVVGGYDCPAATSLNKGLQKRYAPAEKILSSLDIASAGLTIFNRQFIETGLFQKYCQEYHIPQEVANVYRQTLLNNEAEVNLFGNPEMHNEIVEIIRVSEQKGHRVNLTTTGRRFMKEPSFVQAVIEASPHRIALSYDFTSPEQVRDLGNTSPEEINEKWKAVLRERPDHGQELKVYEAAFVAQTAKEIPDFPSILFNLVVHAGNIAQITEIIAALQESFPNVLINPYFDQTAFLGDKSHLGKNGRQVSEFIDRAVDKQFATNDDHLVRRAHWWLMMKAAIETYSKSPEKMANSIAGQGIWKCYEQPGAGRYFQIAASTVPYADAQIPGLRPNCFWNSQTIADDRRIYALEPADIAAYILQGSREIAKKATSPCQGCAFPRLTFDAISTEIGMDPNIKPAYLELRKGYVGF